MYFHNYCFDGYPVKGAEVFVVKSWIVTAAYALAWQPDLNKVIINDLPKGYI